MSPEESRYRWVILTVGTAAQTSFSAVFFGVPVLAPALRDDLGLSLGELGVALASVNVGMLLSLYGWGVLADRFGERVVMAIGLAAAAGGLVGAALATSYVPLIVALCFAGGFGAAVNAASGRAVVSWFGASERGLALGIRQAAIPIGGIAAALTLPSLVGAWGLDAGFLALAAGCLLASGLALSRIRDVDEEPATPAWPVRSVIRDGRFLVLCSGSSLLVVAQIALAGFLVLFLHDERGFSAGAAAGVLALVQVIGGALRVAVGRWSDRVRTRIEPLRQLGFALTASLALTAALTDAASWLVVPALVVAGALSFSWNGLSFTAAAELAGRARSGAALGFQQTALAAASAVTPLAFAAVAAFPLAGSLLLGRIAALRAA